MLDQRDAIELKLLRCFVVLAEELNFGRAATRLSVTQPALSAQLRQLEQRLGLPLFERTTRRVSLTEPGEALLPGARALLVESRRFSDVVASLHGVQPRRLVMGAAFYTIEIPERQALLEGFFARHPEVPFEVSTQWQRELAQALIQGEVDMALLLGVPASREQRDAEPVAEIYIPDALPRMVLREEPVGLLIPRESPLAEFATVPAAALAGANVAMLGAHHGSATVGPITKLFNAAGARLIVPPEPHGIAVERYGRQFRMPAVTLGWFNTGGGGDGDMVRRRVEGLTLTTQLALVRSPESVGGATELFWQEARSQYPRAPLFNVGEAA